MIILAFCEPLSSRCRRVGRGDLCFGLMGSGGLCLVRKPRNPNLSFTLSGQIGVYKHDLRHKTGAPNHRRMQILLRYRSPHFI